DVFEQRKQFELGIYNRAFESRECVQCDLALFFGEYFFNARLNRMPIFSRGKNPNLAAMSWNAFGVDHFQSVHSEKVSQTCQRVVAKMFVINRVVLECFEQRAKVMGLAHEDTIVTQEG